MTGEGIAEKHIAESVCIICGGKIEYIDPQDGERGVWRHSIEAMPSDHEAVPPLMFDPNRVLAYDAVKDKYILKLDLDQLQCVRAGLVEMATRMHPTTDWKGADKLFHQITEEMPKHICEGDK